MASEAGRSQLKPPAGLPADEHGNFIPVGDWDAANWTPYIHAPKHALTAKDGAAPERRRSKT